MTTTQLPALFGLSIALGFVSCTIASAQEATPPTPQQPVGPAAVQPFPDLTIPEKADVATLQQVIMTAKSARPQSADQYRAQQIAIREASTQLIKVLPKDQPPYLQAELDSIISAVALLAFFNEDEKSNVVEQVKKFLTDKEQLSIQDIQMGLMAAGMLELQPSKAPSRELYQLLDSILEKDSREEMQSLRINLQASIRRLDMLGKPFELDATTIDGKEIRVGDYAGKFVLVAIFASWDPNCVAELNLVNAHYQRYAQRGLEVIGISLDEQLERLQDHLKSNPLPWPIVHDGSESPLDRLALKYGISALPTILLLNKEGTVVSLDARSNELNRLMQLLFESPEPLSTDASATSTSEAPDAVPPLPATTPDETSNPTSESP